MNLINPKLFVNFITNNRNYNNRNYNNRNVEIYNENGNNVRLKLRLVVEDNDNRSSTVRLTYL